MGYLSQSQLEAMAFKKLGKGVKISEKASIYNADQIEIDDYSRIDDFCVISGKLSLGQYVHIASFCLLAGGTIGIHVGDFSGIAYGSQVFSQSDDYSGEYMYSPLIPEKYKKVQKAAIHIDKHVIIGAHSVILPGVVIAEGCSIGAMTLVTKKTDPWGIYHGIPARRIKEKKRDLLLLTEKFLQERNDY